MEARFVYHFVLRLFSIVLLTSLLLASTGAGSILPVRAQTASISALPDVYSTLLLADGEFVFGPNVGDFDLLAFLKEQDDPFLEYGSEILAQADRFSINPRLMLATLHVLYDGQEIPVSLPTSIFTTAELLRTKFSWHRYNLGELAPAEARSPDAELRVAGEVLQLRSTNSATYAVASLFAEQAGTRGQWETMMAAFPLIYEQLFPDTNALVSINSITPPGPPPSDLLQLPFPRSASWKFNGPHNKNGGSTNYTRPWPSMDLGLAGTCASPPEMWAAAAASGTIQKRSSEYGLRIDHGDGWQTAYYHLRDIWSRFDPNGGDTVSQNDSLGRISCLYDPGGYADVPHVHFSLLYNGEYVDIAQPNPGGGRTRLSGYEVYEGGAPYLGKLVREREVPVYNYVYNGGQAPTWATLNITVRLENPSTPPGFTHANQVAVVLLKPGTKQILFGPGIVSTDANGYYSGLSLTNVQYGSYDICAKARHYLGQCAHNVTVNPGSTISIDFSNGGSTPAWTGDTDIYGEDNEVNALDFERIKAACMLHCGHPYAEYDLNRDGLFGAWDASFVLSRWGLGLRGEGAYNRPFAAGALGMPQVTASGSGAISIEPWSGNLWIGLETNSWIKVDTGGDSIAGVDTIIHYDPAILEVLDDDGGKAGVQITNTGVFPSTFINQADPGKGIIRFSAGYGDNTSQFNGTATLAIIHFRVIASPPSSAFYTMVIPEVVADTSDDSNGAQYNTAVDVLTSSILAAYNIYYDSPVRPEIPISLSIPSGSTLGQHLVDVSASVGDPNNQVECVSFSLSPGFGASVSQEDCDGSDGWGVQLDTSSMADQDGLTLSAVASLRATPASYWSESTGITLDRTPPEVPYIGFTPEYAAEGGTVQIDVIDAYDLFSDHVYADLYVNTANDSSESGDWILIDSRTLTMPTASFTTWWDTTGFAVGSHLIALTLLDDPGNWRSTNTVISILPVPAPDSYETDDGFWQATWMDEGDLQRHSIVPATDQDWYRFRLIRPSSVRLETTGVTPADTRMWLYDADLVELAYNDDKGSDYYSLIDLTCGVDDLPMGSYYVKIDEYGNNNEIPAYDISFDITGNCAPYLPPPPVDIDGDYKTDMGTFHPATGLWSLLSSTSNFGYDSPYYFTWGQPGDIAVRGDYDGDQILDPTVRTPPAGGQSAAYRILLSSTSFDYAQSLTVPAGWPGLGDTPVPGDYNGDGKTDPAIWRGNTGVWIIPLSPDFNSYQFFAWGASGDTPVGADVDGDMLTDIGYWRPSSGVWGFLQSSAGYSYDFPLFFSWGAAGDIPVMADYDRDNYADPAVVIPPAGGQSRAYRILLSSMGDAPEYSVTIPAGWPGLGDTPVPLDFDGDGRADAGIWRANTGVWIIPKSSTNNTRYIFRSWGASGDQLVK